MILPSNPGDVNSFVAQALAVYNHVSTSNQASIKSSENVKSMNACINASNAVEYNQLNEEKSSVKMNIE